MLGVSDDVSDLMLNGKLNAFLCGAELTTAFTNLKEGKRLRGIGRLALAAVMAHTAISERYQN